MTPIFKRMPGKVVVAVAISLVAGLYATDLLDNARILGLLPFFVLGLKMHEGHWNLLRDPAGPLVRLRRAARPVRARPVLRRLVRDRVVLLPHPLRRARPRQPAGDHDPDVAADRRPGRRRSRSSRSCRGRRPGSPRWAGPPWWSTCSTASSCWAPSSPATRAGRPTTCRSPLVLVTVAGGRARARRWRGHRSPPGSTCASTRSGAQRRRRARRGSAVVGVEVGSPARGDRVERHLVEPGPRWRGRCVTAEVGRVPGGDLARSGPVVRQLLETLEQAGQGVPELVGPLGQVVPGRDVQRGAEGEVDPPPAGPVDRRLGVADGEDPLGAPDRRRVRRARRSRGPARPARASAAAPCRSRRCPASGKPHTASPSSQQPPGAQVGVHRRLPVHRHVPHPVHEERHDRHLPDVVAGHEPHVAPAGHRGPLDEDEVGVGDVGRRQDRPGRWSAGARRRSSGRRARSAAERRAGPTPLTNR